MTGDLIISAANPQIILEKTATNTSLLTGRKGGLNRWQLALGNNASEAGANAGSDLAIFYWNDAGTIGDTALTGKRSDGLLTVKGDPQTALGIATKQYVDVRTPSRFPLAGIKQIDIPVPVGAVVAQITGTLYPQTAATVTPLIQISVASGVFLNAAGNYTLDGFEGIVSGTAIVPISAQSTALGYLVASPHSNANIPIIFNATVTLKRSNAGSVFACDARCNTFANVVNSHGFYSNYASAVASGSTLSILALRFLNASTENFGNESYLNVEWM
jgi:hypothetical protein